jgi:hypothetical protein
MTAPDSTVNVDVMSFSSSVSLSAGHGTVCWPTSRPISADSRLLPDEGAEADKMASGTRARSGRRRNGVAIKAT